MSTFSVPESVFNKLKCHICKGYLSIPPISGSEGRYTCGRCEPSKHTNHLYEELAGLLSFPCSHEGCKTKISWKDVANHEMVCTYKPIICPFLHCSIKMEARIASPHFNICHKDFKHTDSIKGVELILRHIHVPLETVHCVVFREIPYFVFVRLTQLIVGNSVRYQLAIGAFSLTESTNQHVNYQVDLKLESSKETSKLARQKLKIQPYKEQLHCFQCLNKECTLRGHRNAGDFLGTKFPGLDPGNNMSLTYSVRIYDPTEVTPEKRTHSTNNTGIASSLECPICTIYMCAPIYNCPKGHSICGNCRQLIQECPSCKTVMGDSRNYILEGISETVEIPCHNAEKGCEFLGLVKDATEHEVSCLFDH